MLPADRCQGRRKSPCALDRADDLVGDVLMNIEAFFAHGRSPLRAGRAIAASWGKGTGTSEPADQTPRLKARREAGRSCTSEARKRAALNRRRDRSS